MILTIQLKRFHQFNGEKNKKVVSFKEKLNIAPYMSAGQVWGFYVFIKCFRTNYPHLCTICMLSLFILAREWILGIIFHSSKVPLARGIAWMTSRFVGNAFFIFFSRSFKLKHQLCWISPRTSSSINNNLLQCQPSPRLTEDLHLFTIPRSLPLHWLTVPGMLLRTRAMDKISFHPRCQLALILIFSSPNHNEKRN